MSAQTLCEYARHMLYVSHNALVPAFLQLPSRAELIADTPPEFVAVVKRLLPDVSGDETIVVCVVDTWLVETECPSNPLLHRLTYSQHHKCHGVKSFSLCAASGRILHTHAPLKASAADSSILKHELFADDTVFRWLISLAGVIVIVLGDRGFRLGPDVSLPPNLRIITPATVESFAQYSPVDAESNTLKSHLRWVVEAAQSRMKIFKLLRSQMTVLSIIDGAVLIQTVAALVNRWFEFPASKWLQNVVLADSDDDDADAPPAPPVDDPQETNEEGKSDGADEDEGTLPVAAAAANPFL